MECLTQCFWDKTVYHWQVVVFKGLKLAETGPASTQYKWENKHYMKGKYYKFYIVKKSKQKKTFQIVHK